MEWEVLFFMFTWFRGQTLAKQATVTSLCLLLLAGMWYYDYEGRVEVAMRDMQYKYEEHLEIKEDCKQSAKSKRLYAAYCKEATQETAVPLEKTAREKVWAKTHLCGAHTCTDWLFGVDSTAIGIGARLLVFFCIIAMSVLVFVATRKATVWMDLFMKKRAIERNAIPMRRAASAGRKEV